MTRGAPSRHGVPRAAAVLLVAVVAYLWVPQAGARERYDPRDVAAVMLVKLTSFIRWHPNHRPQASLSVLVRGDTAFADRLARMQRVSPRQHHILVSADPKTEPERPPHVLFLGCGERARVRDLVDRTRGRGVLTASRCQGFAALGVAINFFESEGRMRFEVNPRALERAGLSARYQLLSLARIVEDR